MAHPYSVAGLRRGIGPFVQGRMLSGALGLVVALLLVRSMAVEQYAVYAAMGSLVVLVTEAVAFGMPHVISRFIPLGRMQADPADFRRFVWRLTAVRFTLAAVAAALLATLTVPIATLFNATHAREAVPAACIFLLAYIGTHHVAHTLEASMSQDAVRTGLLVEWALKLLIVVGWIVTFPGITAAEALLIQAGTAFGGLGLMAWLLSARLRALAGGSAAGSAQRGWPADGAAIARFSLQNYVHTVLLLPTDSYGVRLIAASYMASVQMAAFGFFHALANALRRYLPVNFLLATIEPLMMARYAETKSFERMNQISNLLVKANVTVVAPLVAWLAIVGPQVVGLLTGGKYVEYAWVFPLVLLEPLLEARWYLLRTASNAVDRPGFLVGAAVAGLVPLAAMLAILAAGAGDPLHVILGGMVVLPLVRNVWVVLRLRAAGFRYRLDLWGLTRIALSAAAAGIAAFGLARVVVDKGDFAFAAVATMVFVGAYPAVLLAARPFSREELETIQRVAGSRLPIPARWRTRS